MLVDAVVCSECADAIWSRNRHDFRYCKCGATFVDGGRDYLRYGTAVEGAGKPLTIKMEVEESTLWPEPKFP